MDQSEQDIVIHLVHGTWGGGDCLKNLEAGSSPAQPLWFEAGSEFRQTVCDALAPELRSRVRFEGFCWSGENSYAARTQAAQDLAFSVRMECVETPGCRQILVGHSHGGTVIADALQPQRMVERVLSSFSCKDANVIGVVTLGTPFVVPTLIVSRERIGAFAGLALLLPLLAIVIAWGTGLALWLEEQTTIAWILALSGLLAACGLRDWTGFGFKNWNGSRLANVWGAAVTIVVPAAICLRSGSVGELIDNLGLLLMIAFAYFGLLMAIVQFDWLARLFTQRSLGWAVQSPESFDWPEAPGVPLRAIRFPGDEATFAINTAQALVWAQGGLFWLVNASCEWFFNLAGWKRAGIIGSVLLIAVACLQISAPQTVWYEHLIVVIYVGCLLGLVVSLAVGYAWVCLKLLTTLLLAIATGAEVFDAVGAIQVYCEPLPRWRDQAGCRLQIAHWTRDEEQRLPVLSHFLHDVASVRKIVASAITEFIRASDPPSTANR